MNVSAHAVNLCKQFEGFYSKAYLCPAGKWTIGWGHTKDVKPGDVCSKELAEIYLKEDLQEAARVVEQYVKVPLNQNQVDALASFCFNVRPSLFRNSTLLKKLNKGDYAGAAEQFSRWIYGGDQNGDKKITKADALLGLIKRRAAERALFLSND